MNNITLLAEDVSGANLREGISLFDHSMQELKRWLECRGLKKMGKKTDLVERIKNCIDAGREHYIFLGVDGGLWYDKKREITIQASSSSASSSITSRSDGKWNKFPSVNIPKYFNKGHIYTSIVGPLIEDEECEIQNESTTEKPFRRGSQYVDSDHVHDVMDKLEVNIFKLRAFCFASFQKHQRNKGHSSIASTSKLGEWGLGTKDEDPDSVGTKKYKNLKNPSLRTNFEMRSKGYTREINVNDYVAHLQRSKESCIYQSVLKIQYDDFAVDEEYNNILRKKVEQFRDNMANFLNGQLVFNNSVILRETTQGSEKWKIMR
ncbi:hypothetical protein JTB14_025475 [Gonioctena quinquepunctata]|nr:hypothetical protein JTB14_025475 [Gonioctena quinquepunctata]